MGTMTTTRLQSFTFLLLSLYLIIHALIIGKMLLIPMIIAIFLWHLLNTLAKLIKNSVIFGKHLPQSLCLLFALLILMLVLYKLGEIITNNVNDVIQTAPRYQQNLLEILNNFGTKFKLKTMSYIQDTFNQLSFRSIFINIYSLFTGLTSNAFLITLYIGFLFIEQRVMQLKLTALFPDKKHLKLAEQIISQIVSDTQTYIGIKSAMSLLTAFSSWLIMKAVGLDFAEFWALLIFFLNFIPNIGSIIATVFPVLISLIQFQHSWWPFVVVSIGIITVQFIVGNLIEPRFLGRSLNLSPLVILLALAIWGSIWGIYGLFLSVPITVMMMIVFSHFDKTKPIAILLSQNGQVKRKIR